MSVMHALETAARTMGRQIRLKYLEQSRLACNGMVLSFHEVHSENDFLRELRSGCTVSFLESILIELRRSKWDIVALDEAMHHIGNGNRSRRFAVLTFDDGYRDTLTRALPVLERHDAPFTIYIPTGAATRELNSWWLGLRALFQSHDQVTIYGMERCYECRDARSKTLRHAEVTDWIHEDYRRVPLLEETFRKYNVSLPALNSVYFLDEAELRALACHRLATVGAHTTSHAALSLLPSEQAEHEMIDNRHYLERLLERPILHFAYPYGGPRACGAREAVLAANAGFHTAVTTRRGPVFAVHRNKLHELPRVGVAGTADRIDGFAQQMSRLRSAAVGDFE